MIQYFLEIVRQKWLLLGIIMTLLLLNLALVMVISAYQIPLTADLQAKWNSLHQQNGRTEIADAATLYKQGVIDLEKLNDRISEKRDFAKVLSELYEYGASSAVELGPLSYTPLKIKDESLLSYQLTLSVSGSYAAVKSFLADLQANNKFLVVDSVSFSNNDLFVENVVMNIHMTVYLREGA
jgi:type IV pilus assembly protein PilO